MHATTKSALFLAALVALPAAQASAESYTGWYGTLGAGMNFQNGTGHDTAATPEFKFDQPGLNAMGSVGYAYGDGLRLEGEAFHGNSIVDHADGSLDNTDLFLNAFYDFDLNNYIKPYVGAGIGVGFVGANNIGPTTGTTHVDDSDTKLAYQGVAGFAVPVDSQWSITADYRYIATMDPKFSNSAGGKTRFDNDSHNVMFGVRYNFDAPTRTPVQPARMTQAPRVNPQAAPAPVAAPTPETYQVFFDFNKSKLTKEAKGIIASAANDYKSGKYVRIVVTGHTDTKGTHRYNQKLSDRRAAAVKAEFTKLGVQASEVVTQGEGEKDLLVPTDNHVREAQNRRATIVLEKK